MKDFSRLSNQELLSLAEKIFTLSLHGLCEEDICARLDISPDFLLIIRASLFHIDRKRYFLTQYSSCPLSQILYWVDEADLEALKLAMDLSLPEYESYDS